MSEQANMEAAGTTQPLRKQAEGRLAESLDSIRFGRAHVWIIVLISLGGLFDGMEQFNVSYAAPFLSQTWGLSGSGIGALSSVTFAGLGVGCIVAGITGDKFGRKKTYMYNLLLYTLGALLCAFAPNLTVLLIARLLVGIGLGGELNTGLTMLAELMPTKIRGAAVGTVDVATGGLGIFASSALAAVMLGPLIGLFGGPTVAWRWLFGILAIPALLVFAYRWFIPESPRYHLMKGDVRSTNSVLSKLSRGRLRDPKGAIDNDFITLPQGTAIPPEKVRLMEILRGAMRRRTLVVWIVSLMTFGAQNTVNTFFPTILVERGFDASMALGLTVVINIGGLVGAVFACIFGYRFRRRIVLTVGAISAAVLAVAFGVSTSLIALVVFGGLLQFVFIMCNTTTWIWAPELYPTRTRNFGTGAVITVGVGVGAVFPVLGGGLIDAAGVIGLLAMVAVMYIVMAIVVRFGPETKGVPLEETEQATA